MLGEFSDEEDVSVREEPRLAPWSLPARWWAAIGEERPIVSEACSSGEHGVGDLEVVEPSAVDVYCPEHGNLLLLEDLTSRRRWWWFNVARTAIVGLVVLAASRHSLWPIYLLALVVGAATIGLPLHAHRVGRAVGVIGWVLVAAAAAGIAIADFDDGAMRAVWTGAVAMPLAILVGLSIYGVFDWARAQPRGLDREIGRAVVLAALTAPVLVAAWWIISGHASARFAQAPDAVSRWVLYSALSSVLGGLLAAAVGAFVRSLDELDLRVRAWSAPQIASVGWRYDPRLRGRPSMRTLPAQLLWRLHQLRERLRRSLVAIARQTVNGSIALANIIIGGLVRLANWIRKRLTLLARRVAFVWSQGVRIVGRCLVLAVAATYRARRPAGAFMFAVGAAVSALHLAHGFTLYLVDGPLDGLVAGVAWSALGLAACFAVADRLSSVPTRLMVRAATGVLNNAGPDVILFTVLAGWAVGIPGTLGYGPIRVGWVTGVGTVLLVIIMVPAWLRERGAQPRTAGDVDLATPQIST